MAGYVDGTMSLVGPRLSTLGVAASRQLLRWYGGSAVAHLGRLGGEGIHTIPLKPTGMRALVVAALAGFVVPAETLADCPQLEQLQSALL